MADYSLVPVDYQPDFENVTLVPVEHDPFSEDGVTQQVQGQTQPAQPADQPQQSATGVDRLYVGRSPNNTQEPEPSPSTASTPQPPAPTSNVVTPQQVLQGAINQFYPGAEFSGLAQQAYKNGQYGNAIGYGVGAVAESLLALAGGKLLGPLVAAGLKGIAGSSWALRRALEKGGQVRQAGEVTHHIAAKGAGRADPARAKLRSLGIGIDDKVNGVFLPAEKHNNLHDYKYYDATNKALAGATSKAEAEQILQSIAKRVKSGTFP